MEVFYSTCIAALIINLLIVKKRFNSGSLLLISFIFCYGVTIASAGLYMGIIDLENNLGLNFNNTILPYSYFGTGFFILWWLLAVKNPKEIVRKNTIERAGVKRVFIIGELFAWVTILSIAAACLMLGNIPVISMLLGQLDIRTHHYNLMSLPFGLMALTTAVGMVLAIIHAELLLVGPESGVPKRFYLLARSTLIIASIWQANRQFFLFVVYCHALEYLQNKKVNLTKLLMGFTVASLLFILYFVYAQRVRLNQMGASDYEILGYATFPILNLSSIVLNHSESVTSTPNYIFTELVPWRFRTDDFISNIQPTLFEPTSPSGLIAYWYLDFGNLGAAIAGSLLGTFSGITHVKMFQCKVWYRLNILMTWCCLTAPVYSHLISLNNMIFPAIIILILPSDKPENK